MIARSSAHFGVEHLLGPSKKCSRKQHRRGKTTHDKGESTTSTLAASRPRKRPQKGASNLEPPTVPKESKKTPKRPGPRMAPRQNARKKGRTAKTGDKPGAAGTKKKEQEHKVRCGVCPVSPEFSLLKKQQKTKTKRRRRRATKRKEQTPKTTDLT